MPVLFAQIGVIRGRDQTDLTETDLTQTMWDRFDEPLGFDFQAIEYHLFYVE
jgi:hypothetical protein